MLLIEAGDDQGDNPNNTLSRNWVAATNDTKTRWDFWVENTDNAVDRSKFKYTTYRNPDGSFYVGTSPPPGAVRLGIWYPRAGTLGGCAMHNGASANLPNDAVWNRIAQITGDNSWLASNIRRYFIKLENNLYLPPGSPGHGFGGYINITQPEPVWATGGTDGQIMSELAVNATGYPVSQLVPLLKRDNNGPDPNKDTTTGVYGILSHSDAAGVRSTPNGYIRRTLADAADYPLTLQLDTLVTKVLFSDPRPGRKRAAIGVEYLQGKSMYSADPRYNPANKGTLGRAYATREVIVAGGTFNSPQILKLSGIGPAAELRRFGIPVIVDAPGVGRNLGDNQETGLLSTAARAFVGGFAGIFTVILKTSVAQRVRDIHMFCGSLSFEGFWPGWPNNYGPAQYQCSIGHMYPRGQDGTVLLRSANPRDVPKINFHFFETGGDQDLQALLEAVKFNRRLVSKAPAPLGPFTELYPCPGVINVNATTGACNDAKQKEFIRQQIFSHHATGTCAIGGDGDRNAVLDSKFRVRGVDNLRVVDASVHPFVPGAYPVLPTFVLSEKATEAILQDIH